MVRVAYPAVLLGLFAVAAVPFIAPAGVGAAGLARYNLDAEGRIAAGYDVVAYFLKGSAVPGSADFAVTHDGARYHFASAENLARFLDDPERYVPRLGGFCPLGMTQGLRLAGDPRAWLIHDGGLYLFLDPGTRSVWLMDPDDNAEAADLVWQAGLASDAPARGAD